MAYELTQQDCSRLAEDLAGYLQLSEASAAMLVDRGGSVISSAGHFEGDGEDTLAALTAGSFAATRELAQSIGETGFEAVYHHGHKRSMYILSITSEVILLAVFSSQTQIGLIKLYGRAVKSRLEHLFTAVESGAQVPAADPTVSFVLKR